MEQIRIFWNLHENPRFAEINISLKWCWDPGENVTRDSFSWGRSILGQFYKVKIYEG